MKEMTGTCVFCGQTRLVEAETQTEADRIAAEHCTCDNNLKKVRRARRTSSRSAESRPKASAWR